MSSFSRAPHEGEAALPVAVGRVPALILGAGANGLGAVRGLARKGVEVGVIANEADEPALPSRHLKWRYVLRKEQDRDQALLGVLDRAPSPAVLVPTSDLFVDFLVRHRTTLEQRFQFCLPNDALANLLIDKATETRRVAEIGIPLPHTVEDLSAGPGALLRDLRLPIIVKPRRFDCLEALGRKNVVLADAAATEKFYREYRGHWDALIAQEVIPGPDDTLWVCNASFNPGGELAEAFSFQRLRLTPAHYGVTSYAISRVNRDVIASTARLGRELSYTGPAMVEFKYDSRDGQYKYIEINPRIGLCNLFDTECGVNNVYNSYLLATGNRLAVVPEPHQREGVIYVRLVDDLHSRWKDGESPAAIARHYMSNLARPHVFAFWSWSDPSPGLRLLARDLGRVFSRVRGA
jgi:D-aspartate ligase